MRSRAHATIRVGVALLSLALGLPLAAHSAAVFLSYLVGQTGGAVYPSDFLNYYSAGRMLLAQPSHLYVPDVEALLQRQLARGAEVYSYSQFQNLPQVALLSVPLAVLPYGVAYAVWSLLNLGFLAASAALLAPRSVKLVPWPLWIVIALCCLPVQLALVDGQTSLVALFGFCLWAHLCERGRIKDGAWALLSWAWKPQLLPIPLIVMVRSHAWTRAAAIVAVQLLALAGVLLWAGSDTLARYLQLTREAAQADHAGQTVLGLAQTLSGANVGPMVSFVAAVGIGTVVVAVATLWWSGLHSDPRRWLQLASLPLSAVLVSPRAYEYELSIWLASVWLLLRFTQATGRGRWPSMALLVAAYWATNLATLSGVGGARLPLGTLAGLGFLGYVLWLFHTWREAQPATAGTPAHRRLVRMALGPRSTRALIKR